MTVICGDLREKSVHYATGDGETLTIHVDEPVQGFVTLAFSDTKNEASSVMVLPRNHFNGVVHSYGTIDTLNQGEESCTKTTL